MSYYITSYHIIFYYIILYKGARWQLQLLFTQVRVWVERVLEQVLPTVGRTRVAQLSHTRTQENHKPFL